MHLPYIPYIADNDTARMCLLEDADNDTEKKSPPL